MSGGTVIAPWLAMFAGALVAAMVTTIMIELIHKKTRVKQDAAIGITFSSLFALGVVEHVLVAEVFVFDGVTSLGAGG